MTKKETILAFVETNVNGTDNILQINTVIQDTRESCRMTIGASKARTIQIITENFNDELIGSLPNDSVTHEIQGWEAHLIS
jgi:dTDP-D-glucose 4,6-dehydratase